MLILLLLIGSVNAFEKNETQILTVSCDEKLEIEYGEYLIDSQESTYSELKKEIGNGGDIELTKKIYIYDEGDTINITKSGTIDGKGAIIDMDSKTRALHIEAKNITLKNLIFKNAYSYNENGGAIYVTKNTNTINIINCTFMNNKVQNFNAGCGVIFFEGKLYNSNIDGTFIGNYGGQKGGVLYFGDTITSTTIQGTFINNHVAFDGGALWLNDINNSTINATFANNHADWGGAIFSSGLIYNTTIQGIFTNNSVKISGGAIYSNKIVNNISINGTFINNSADDGGIICLKENAEKLAINGTFINNIVTNGVIYFMKEVKGIILDGTFINNSAKILSPITFYKNVFNSTIKGTFINNDGEYAGVIYFNENASDMNIFGTYKNNNATRSGGAITFIDYVKNTFINGTFLNNYADTYGGILSFSRKNENVTITSIFINNTSITSGIISAGSDVSIINSVLLNDGIQIDVDPNNVLAINNWFGNNATNYNVKPNVKDNVIISNWLFLNATTNPKEITIFNTSEIIFKLYDYNSTTKNISNSTNQFKDIILNVFSTNGTIDKNTINLGDAIVYTPTNVGIGSVTATIGNAKYTIEIIINKASPNLSVESQEIYYNNPVKVNLNYDNTATGKVNISLKGNKFNYSFINLDLNKTILLDKIKVDEYNISVDYSGDERFLNSTANGKIIVKKINSNINIVTYNINVTEINNKIADIVLLNDTTGNVSITINNKTTVIEINNDTVKYINGSLIIEIYNFGLPADNYIIFANYNGDNNYYSSQDNKTFNITKISSEFNVINDALSLNVSVSKNATGNITLIIENKTMISDIVNGVATFDLLNISFGDYNITLFYSGDNIYNEFKVNIPISLENKTIIIAENLTKYYHGPERFVINITDSKNNPIANATVNIFINDINYKAITNKNGSCSIAINLNSGEYPVFVIYNSTQINAKITILTSINGTDLIKVYRNGTQYYSTFRDSYGNYLKNGTEVQFNINGVMYNRKISGDNGLAKLNINLEPGKYVITAMNLITGEYTSNKITVISKLIENTDLTKYYRNASQYTLKVLGEDGNAVGAGKIVKFNINGVFYERKTNESGIVQLNINLQPGDYIITAEYEGCKVSNFIKVLPTLNANDLTKKYGSDNQFVATLLDGQGRPYANQNVQFNINGVLYNRITDNFGNAKLNINLMAGEYIITSSHNELNISNKITVYS